MNYTKLFTIAAFAVASLWGFSADAKKMSDITKAMFTAYEQTLKEDPEDYITYYRRAVEYYRLDMPDEALADLALALKYAPAKDADLLSHAYSLQADVYLLKDDVQKAMASVEKALTIDPKSYYDLYKKGIIALELKDGEAARRSFNAMLPLKTRSQDAFYGLARVALMNGNRQETNALIEEIKNADSTSPLTFTRLGEIYHLMGDNAKSVVNYLTAISLSKNISRPFNALEDVAAEDFDTFRSAIDYVISQAGDGADSYRYIKGVISQDCGKLNDAYSALKQLAANDNSATTMTRLAEVCMQLNKLDEARQYVDKALAQTSDPDACIIRSTLEIADNAPAQAVLYANKSYNNADPDSQALMAMAKAAIAQGDADAATKALNEAILIDAERIDALMLRAYVRKVMQNDKKGAEADMKRAANSPADGFPQVAYKAIAQTLSGKALDGQQTLDNALMKNQSPEGLAYAAIYYTQVGNNAKAKEYADKARAAGLQNIFMLETDRTPYLSMSKTK